MAEQAATPEETKGGGKFKAVLLILIIIMIVGVGVAFYVMMPPKAPELKSYQWPPEGEVGLEVSVTLGDSSAMLMTEVRFVTHPFDWDAHLEAAELELQDKKSVTLSILTEVGNSLDSETSLEPEEFKRRVRKMMNDELTHTEIERILIKNWIITNLG